MKTVLVTGFDNDKFVQSLNNTLETLNNVEMPTRIVDIKFSTLINEGMATKYALVIYE